MRILHLVLIGMLLLAQLAPAAATDPVLVVGKPAPRLSIETLYRTPDKPEDAKAMAWNSFGARFIVVDFSTTWCVPCIKAFPHMNTLQAEFKDRGIAFLTVSDENDKTVPQLASRFKLETLLARDADRSMYRDFLVGGIPFIAIVDSNGMLHALTNPENLKSSHLTALIESKTIKADGASIAKDGLKWGGGFDRELPTSDIKSENGKTSIRWLPSTGMGRNLIDTTRGVLIYRDVGLVQLIAYSISFETRNVKLSGVQDGDRMRVEVAAGDGTISTAKADLLQAVLQRYRVRLERKKEQQQLVILRVTDTSKLNKYQNHAQVDEAEGRMMTNDNKQTFENVPLQTLAFAVGGPFGLNRTVKWDHPVNPAETYSFEIARKNTEGKTVTDWQKLLAPIGIAVTEEMREVEMIYVLPAE